MKKCEENNREVAKYNTRHHFEIVGKQCGPEYPPSSKAEWQDVGSTCAASPHWELLEPKSI